MPSDFLLDDTDESLESKRLRQKKYTRLAWIFFGCTLLFICVPSLIMYFYSPTQVNNFSPIDAHILVIGLFGIGAISLVLMIVFLVFRSRALR